MTGSRRLVYDGRIPRASGVRENAREPVRDNPTLEHPMHPLTSHSQFFTAVSVFAFIGVAGCASAPVGPPIDAPRLAVGDRWQYQITDNLRRGAVSQLDAEGIAVSGGSARIRRGLTDNSGRAAWSDP